MTKPEFDITTFTPKLQDLLLNAMPAARTSEQVAEVVTALTEVLAAAISVAAEGDNKIASTMISGVEGLLSERCAELRKVGPFLGAARRQRS